LREVDLNHRPSGYETDVLIHNILTLLYIKRHSKSLCIILCTFQSSKNFS